MRHGFASLGSGSFMTAFLILIFILAIGQSDGEFGVLNLVLIPLGSAIICFGTSILFFIPLVILRERFTLTYWLIFRIFVYFFIVIIAVPSVWFYGLRTQAHASLKSIIMVLGFLMIYLAIGLVVHFMCFHLHRKLNPLKNGIK